MQSTAIRLHLVWKVHARPKDEAMKRWIGAAALLLGMLLSGAEPFTDNDIGRLLCLDRPVSGVPAGSFLVVDRVESPREIVEGA
ncbi:hypothetical protein SDC9_109299 [bioreactor metagenome]|uniref:Uncharacterized protein n=1 Tax=bioreactor metagenome TaxID=1076179 RepID=A0A645BBI6_9ZZZZ